LVEEVYDFGREAASLSAILTSSANDRACVFRITGPRWTFTALLSPSNLLAGAIGRDHHHHLALTWRQRIELHGVAHKFSHRRGERGPARSPAGSRPADLDRGRVWSKTLRRPNPPLPQRDSARCATMHGASRLSGTASSEERHIALSNFTDLYISSLVPPRIVTTYLAAEPTSLLGGAALRFGCLILLIESDCRSARASTS